MSYTLADLNVRQPTPAVTTQALSQHYSTVPITATTGPSPETSTTPASTPASTINPDLAESTNPEQKAQAMPPKIASE